MVIKAFLNTRGKTTAVLPGVLDIYYLVGHDALIKRVSEAGPVVSEIAPGVSPAK